MFAIHVMFERAAILIIYGPGHVATTIETPAIKAETTTLKKLIALAGTNTLCMGDSICTLVTRVGVHAPYANGAVCVLRLAGQKNLPTAYRPRHWGTL